MPKAKKKRQQPQPTPQQSSTRVKPWVRWVAMGIIFALGMSLLAGALSAQAATIPHANQSSTISESVLASSVTPIKTQDETTCLLDNDGDGVANPDDPDVDGDGTINGEDTDIDGDGVVNQKDGDPVATNCNDSASPPLVGVAYTAGEPVYDWKPVLTFSLLGVALIGVSVALIFRRKPKPQD